MDLLDSVSSYGSAPTKALAGASSAALFCLFFFSRNTVLDRQIAEYVYKNQEEIDPMFGPDLHGFVMRLPDGPGQVGAIRDMYGYARAYEVDPDRFPCALLSTKFSPGEKALRVPFAEFLPPQTDRQDDDVGLAFQAIASAAKRCAGVPEGRRIRAMQRALREARHNVYGDRAPKGKRVLKRVSGDIEVLAQIASDGKRLATVALAAGAMVIGGSANQGAADDVHGGSTQATNPAPTLQHKSSPADRRRAKRHLQ